MLTLKLGMLSEQDYDQNEAIKQSDVFRIQNLVQNAYIQEFNVLDNKEYNWMTLVQKYPLLNRSENFEKWVFVFPKIKQSKSLFIPGKSVAINVPQDFHSHCQMVQLSAGALENVANSEVFRSVNGNSIYLYQGDASTLLGVPKKPYGK